MFLDVSPMSPAESALGQANEFVDRLAQLPPPLWAQIGAAVGQRNDAAYSTASAFLEACVADQRLRITAWAIRDNVDSAACYAVPFASRMSLGDRLAITAARSAAQRAALALVVRGCIAEQDVAALYRPFAEYIPVDLLAATQS